MERKFSRSPRPRDGQRDGGFRDSHKETDVATLLQQIQRQLNFLEKKIDMIVDPSGARSSRDSGGDRGRRPGGGGGRPSFGGSRPGGRSGGGRPSFGGRPSGGGDRYGGKPSGDRYGGGKPSGDRYGDKPAYRSGGSAGRNAREEGDFDRDNKESNFIRPSSKPKRSTEENPFYASLKNKGAGRKKSFA